MSGSVSSGLLLSGIGIAIVFVVLAFLAALITVVRRLDERWQTGENAARSNAFDQEPSIDSITLVLIAAAAAAVVGRHHIRRIRRLRGPRAGGPWSQQGRIVLQGSHAIVRRPPPPRRPFVRRPGGGPGSGGQV